ncbi:MAG: BlaI/MecI/CopY family transcriptional regulator [Acidimicrobiales bacterium]
MSLRRPNGALEAHVLRALWSCPIGMTPGEILEAMGVDVTYTTVTAILARLQNKRLVTRRKHGRAFVYRPRLDEAALTAKKMKLIFSAAADKEAALARFVGGLSKADARSLRRVIEKETGRG